MPRAIPKSTSLDIIIVKDFILPQIDEKQLVDKYLQGPLPNGLVGLIIGKSSNYKRNFKILPGIKDTDYTDIIKVIIQLLN